MWWPQGPRYSGTETPACILSLFVILAFRGRCSRRSFRVALLTSGLLRLLISSRSWTRSFAGQNSFSSRMWEEALVAFLTVSVLGIPPACSIVYKGTLVLTLFPLALEIKFTDFGRVH